MVAAAFDSNTRLLSDLQVDSQILDLIQEDFLKVLHPGKIKVHSFLEGRGLTGVRGMSGKVSVVKLSTQTKVFPNRFRSSTISQLKLDTLLRHQRRLMQTTARW
jgi:hypothetical protein